MEPILLSTLCAMTIAGVLAAILAIITSSSKIEEEPEEPEEPEEEQEFENEFTNYLATRLDASSAFRSKILVGLTALYQEYPHVYSQVMKPRK